MNSKPVILTHGDLDGMTSAIMLLRRLPPETRVIITNGQKLLSELDKIAAASDVPPDIFIADIPLVARYVDRVESAIRRLVEQESRVHLYDHHLCWQDAALCERFRSACTTLVVDAGKTTAAALVWKHYLKTARDAQHWLQMLSEKNASADPTIRLHFGILAALMQPQHWKMTASTLKALAHEKPLSEEQNKMAEWYYEEHLPRERAIVDSAEVITTAAGRRIAWLDLRDEKQHFSVSKAAIEKHGAELAATVIRSGVLLGGASIDEGLDLTFLHGRHEHDGIGFNVVGHKSPVKFVPLEGDVTDEFVQAIRSFVFKALLS
ncbi:MAG TPA: hypothetical protein ENN09_01680 [Planctomycetes bacterium]|nr:hypothetical protein [Planctomycetota bacterium]